MFIFPKISIATRIIISSYYMRFQLNFYACIVLEFIQILTSILKFSSSLTINIDYENQLLHTFSDNTGFFTNDNITKINSSNEIFISNNLQYMSFSHLIKKNLICENTTNISGNLETICYYTNNIFYIFFAILIVQNFYLIIISYTFDSSIKGKNVFKRIINEYQSSNKNANICNVNLSLFKKLFTSLFVNLFDFFFHIFGSFILDLLINTLFVSFKKGFIFKYFDFNTFIFLLSVFALVLYTTNYIWFIRNINSIITFSEKISMPYDNLFSSFYDLCILIIKIFININNNLELIANKNNYIYLFFKFSIFLISLFFISTILDKILEGKILFITNDKLNCFRLFNILNINVIYIFEFIFQTKYLVDIVGISLLFFSFILSLILTLTLNKMNFNNIVGTNKIIYQLGYILNLLKTGVKTNDLKKYSINFILQHRRACASKICEIMKVDDFNNTESIIIAYKKEVIRNKIHKISKFDISLRFVCLAILSNIKNKNPNKVLIKLFFLRKHLDITRMNNEILVVLQLLLNELKNEILKETYVNSNPQGFSNKKFIDFEFVSFYSDLFIDFQKSSDLIVDTIICSNTMSYDNLFKNCAELNKVQNSILERYFLLNKFKGDYQDLYSFFFIKFIFKRLFNNKLQIENEINMPLDFKNLIISYYYNDSFINLILKENSLIIIKASKEYIDYIGKDFTVLFPQFYREYAKNKFLNIIENSNGFEFKENFIFQFDNLQKKYEHYLKVVHLDCKYFPSCSLTEILITIKCSFLNEEILVFEEDVKNSSKSLKFCSEKICKIICLSNKMLSSSVSSKIAFRDIFNIKSDFIPEIEEKDNIHNDQNNYIKDKSSQLGEYKNKLINRYAKNVYFIDYVIYKKSYHQFLRYLKEKDLINEDEFFDLQANFSEEKIKLYVFDINIFDFVPGNIYNYKIFSLKFLTNKFSKFSSILNNPMSSSQDMTTKEHSNNKNKKYNLKSKNVNNNSENSENQLSNNFITNNENEIHHLKLQPQEIYLSENSQSISQTISKDGGIHNKNYKKDLHLNSTQSELNRKTRKNNKRIKSFIYSLIGLIIFLFIFGIAILAISIYKINEIKSVFNLHFNYKRLVSSYDGLITNLIQNIQLFKRNSYVKDYIETDAQYSRYYRAGLQIKFSEYLNYEIQQRMDKFTTINSDFKVAFFDTSYTQIKDEFINKKIENYYVSNSMNNIEIKIKEIDFFSLLEIFITNSKILSANPDKETFIYIMKSNEGNVYNFDNYANKSLNNYQLNAMNLIVNYEPILNNMEYFKNLLFELYMKQVNDMQFIITFSSVFLLIFHFIVCLLIIFIVKYFKRFLHSNICNIEFLLQEENQNFIITKITYLKRLSLLYKDNPNEIIKKLKQIKIKFKTYKLTDFNKNTDDVNYIDKIYKCHNNLIIKNKFENNLLEQNQTNFKMNNVIYNSASSRNYLKNNINSQKNGLQNLSSNIVKANPETPGLIYNDSSPFDFTQPRQKNQTFAKHSYNLMVKSSFFWNFYFITFIFILIFSFYFFIIFVSFKIIHNENKNQNDFAEQFWILNHKTIKNAFGLNLFLLLNQTENLVSKKLFSTIVPEKLFSFEINNLIKDVNTLHKSLFENSRYDLLKPYFNEYVDCGKIYYKLYNDDFYIYLNKIYNTKFNKTASYASDNLKKLCEFFKFTSLHNYFVFYGEIIRLNKAIFFSLDYSNKAYDQIKKIYDGAEFKDLLIIIILILRPIRRYIENNPLATITTQAFDSYIKFIILILIFNFFVEILFFVIIKKFVINKTQKIDNDMKNFIKCLFM